MLARMRTINQYIAECKAADPSSAITSHLIRRLISEGKLSYIKAGKKFILVADAADAYFASGQTEETAPQVSTIRPVNLKRA